MSRATVPAWRTMGSMRRSKAPLMISMTSSGSRVSAMAVEPLTSEKRVVTRRRSVGTLPRVATRRSAYSWGTRRNRRSVRKPGAEAGVPAVGRAGADNSAPQAKQNRASGGNLVLQCGQVRARLAPQCRQNLAPSGFSVLHWVQCMSVLTLQQPTPTQNTRHRHRECSVVRGATRSFCHCEEPAFGDEAIPDVTISGDCFGARSSQ